MRRRAQLHETRFGIAGLKTGHKDAGGLPQIVHAWPISNAASAHVETGSRPDARRRGKKGCEDPWEFSHGLKFLAGNLWENVFRSDFNRLDSLIDVLLESS